MLAVLVGVDHRIQYTNASCGREWKEDIARFEEYLAQKAQEHKIELFGEEFNEELVERNQATACTVRDAAMRLGIRHIFCEPGSQERESGNITTDQRECEWLLRLRSEKASRLLFVCGDNHLKSFSEKLRRSGFEVHVLGSGWGKDWALKQ